MLASINPLGERGRQQHYWITVTAYVVASTVAGAALGGLAGAVGSVVVDPSVGDSVATAVFVAVAALCAVGLVLDARGAIPGPHRQVDENWLARYRGWVYGAGFGIQLGLAFTTIVIASATWVAFACAALSGSATGGVIVGTTFGLVRALPILATARVREPNGLRALWRRLERVRPIAARVTTATQVTVAVALLGAALTGLAGVGS